MYNRRGPNPGYGSEAEEAKDLLNHFAQWLEANDLLDLGKVSVPDEWRDANEEATGEVVRNRIVDRYMELQWGEDREDEWGHAFDGS